MPKINPFLRFDKEAEEAARFYCSVFPNSKILSSDGLVTSFQLENKAFGWVNGWPIFTPNPSISFSAWITDKEITKQIWDKLVDGWTILMEFSQYPWSEAYGRCSDRYGVSRQIMYDNREEPKHNEIITSLMYTWKNAGKAEEAINFYSSIFPNASTRSIHRYGPGEGDVEGTIAHAEFLLDGQLFIALDSSLDHKFNFTEWVSLVVNCDGQEEVDYYRNKLIEDGGEESQCGRCKDKFGVSRQVVPSQLMEALHNSDTEKAQYAMSAMMKMKKIVIEELYTK